jgi:hypothetical protein
LSGTVSRNGNVRLIRAPAIAFAAGFLVVGAWKLTPMVPNLWPVDTGRSFFADGGRIGYPASAPLVRPRYLQALTAKRRPEIMRRSQVANSRVEPLFLDRFRFSCR